MTPEKKMAVLCMAISIALVLAGFFKQREMK